MIKLYRRLSMIVLGIFIFAASAMFVVHNETEKAESRLETVANSYKAQTTSLGDYKTAYTMQVEQLRAENVVKMADHKAKYEILLAQQPQLIQQHTVVSTTTQPSSKPTSTSSNTTTIKKAVKVSKPASKPVTGAS